MLIKALCDYYEILAKTNRVLPSGYSNVKIHYLISLTPEGKIDRLIDYQKKEITEGTKGKTKEKLVPRILLMPKRTEKPGIDANIVEHRPLYLFGLNLGPDGFTAEDRTNKAQKSHQAFVQANLEFIKGLDSPLINAYRAFLENWKPEEEQDNLYLSGLGKSYGSSGYAFCLSGHPEQLLHEEVQIKKRWEEVNVKQEDTDDQAVIAQCGVSGEQASIARIHNKIKGVYGGLATGSVLIGFKNDSGKSYGNDQAYNSNISEKVMVRYTEALNYLLGDRSHKASLDDVTFVFWAMSENNNNDAFMAALLFGDSELMNAEQTENMLKNLMESARKGNIVTDRLCSLEQIDPDVDFYILGLKPNSSRIAMKFFYRRKYADVLWNIAQHQNDLQISETPKPVPLWRIKKELISPKGKNDMIDPALLTKIFEAVVYGTAYPSFLLSTIVRRVKTDTDLRINEVRAGIIKACINRKSRILHQKEELNVALDKENRNPAYLCGRLFAVLERLQQAASNTQLNRTIKDAYFASASAKPAIVFPKLMRLAQNHLAKTKSAVYYNILIGEILDKLNGEFPDWLALTEQGKFIIGYYQQTQSFFAKQQDKNNTAEEETNDGNK